MELIPSFEGRHYKNQGNQKDQGPRTGKGERVSSREFVVCSMMVFGAMVDIYCDLVGWPSNTLYRIGPGSKPGACGSDREVLPGDNMQNMKLDLLLNTRLILVVTFSFLRATVLVIQTSLQCHFVLKKGVQIGFRR